MVRNWSMRFKNPFESCCHSKFCRKTRTLVKPSPSAQLSSRSIVTGSNESACHISNWLMAVLGLKLQPTIQTWLLYQALAFSSDQRVCALAKPQLIPNISSAVKRIFVLFFMFIGGKDLIADLNNIVARKVGRVAPRAPSVASPK